MSIPLLPSLVGAGAPTPLFWKIGGHNATFNKMAGLGGGGANPGGRPAPDPRYLEINSFGLPRDGPARADEGRRAGSVGCKT